MRPRDIGASLKTLHIQFCICAGSEVAAAISHFRGGDDVRFLLLLANIPFWLITYWLGLNLGRKAAQLPQAELSYFLCNTILLGGVRAMTQMIFFIFEAVSWMASGDELEDDQCENISSAAMSLSCYLAIVAAVSVASKTVPQEERGEVMTYYNMAIF